MDQRETRQYVSANPPPDYNAERRPSLLGRLLGRRTSSTSDDMNMGTGLQRRESIDPEVPGSITQRVQQEMKKPVTIIPKTQATMNSPEFSIFT